MSIDYDTENWLGNPIQEEMLEHHARLVEAENELLRMEVDRYRTNQAKLIDMVSALTIERDKLAKDLGATRKHLSDSLLDASNLGNRVMGLERCREQLEAIHRRERQTIPGHKLRIDPTA